MHVVPSAGAAQGWQEYPGAQIDQNFCVHYLATGNILRGMESSGLELEKKIEDNYRFWER
jgi:hypothetical protein